jgi:glycosyltransferase involved in cell wall biosynthesis
MVKIRIAQIIPYLNIKMMGGIGRFLQTLVLSIDKQQAEIHIICYQSSSLDREYYHDLGINTYTFLEEKQENNKNAIQTIEWLIKTISKINPDVVHTHYFWGDVLGIKAASLAKVPIIVSTNHNLHYEEKPQEKRIKKHLNTLLTKIICVSKSVKKYAEEVEKIPNSLLTVIYYGINLQGYPFPEIFPAILNNNNQFVYVGRLETQKAPLKLINAFHLILEKGYTAQLTIIGDGELKPQCENQVKELKLAQQVQFLGYQSQPWQQVKPGSVLILTSNFEGLPFSVLEAMACGCLCILPNLEPLLEIANDGKEAFFYDAGNIEHLVSTMELVLNMSIIKKLEMIKLARVRVENVFNADGMANQYLNLYQKLCKNLFENLKYIP